MILWFGKKKKKKEMEEAGAALEAADPSIAERGEVEPAPPPGEELEAADRVVEDAPHSDLSSLPGTQATSPASGGGEFPVPPISEEPEAEPEPGIAPLEPLNVDPNAAAEDVAADVEPDPGPEIDPVAETKKPGLLKRLTSGLSRSSSKLTGGLTGLFTKTKLDDETLEELEDLLITSDMGAKVAGRITTNIAKDRFDKEVSDEEIRAALAGEIADILKPRELHVDFSDGPRPRVVLFVGVNGSGKTTTIGKIASKLKEQGASALMVAGDTFRAAAIEQITVWGERAGIPVLAKAPGADAAGLVYEAVEKAKAEDLDLVLVDTAGRLQNKTELMAELSKILRVVRKLDPDAPHDVILVLDATVGQNALSQVEAFRSTAEVTGLVITKLDGTAKGGVLVAIAEAHALPIHYVGIGERAEDLEPFSADAFAKALVGVEDE